MHFPIHPLDELIFVHQFDNVYAFLIQLFQHAIECLQGKTINDGDSLTPMCFYLFPVNKGNLKAI